MYERTHLHGDFASQEILFHRHALAAQAQVAAGQRSFDDGQPFVCTLAAVAPPRLPSPTNVTGCLPSRHSTSRQARSSLLFNPTQTLVADSRRFALYTRLFTSPLTLLPSSCMYSRLRPGFATAPSSPGTLTCVSTTTSLLAARASLASATSS